MLSDGAVHSGRVVLVDIGLGPELGELFVYPGDEGTHYFEDPGEAFAEAFAHYRFPNLPVPWRYSPALRPNQAAFRAIREDTLEPWQGRTSLTLSGHVPARGEGAAVESLRTPLDGLVSLRPSSLSRHGYELALRSRAGRLLRSSRNGLDLSHQLDYTVCGQHHLRLNMYIAQSRSGRFEIVENLGPIDPQERLVELPVLAG